VNGSRVFDTVWYLPHENRWRDLNILAYRDTGKLTVEENSIKFNGGKETVVIANVQRVTFGKQGRDFVNNWVKIEYGDSATPSVAFFADGSLHGWGGIFGGTKRILEAVKQQVHGTTG
jgi:hypothetical protein